MSSVIIACGSQAGIFLASQDTNWIFCQSLLLWLNLQDHNQELLPRSEGNSNENTLTALSSCIDFPGYVEREMVIE